MRCGGTPMPQWWIVGPVAVPEPLTAGVILALSLGLLLARPRHLPAWMAPFGGGLAMLAIEAISPAAAAAGLAADWNVVLFFLGLGITSATAERAGLFSAAAAWAARMARGSQVRLLVGVYGVGIAVTAILSNDATALLLTPVVFAITRRLGLDPLPDAYAAALVANAASFLLPVSNPSNLLVMRGAPLGLSAFVARLLVPSLLAIAATLGGLLVVFRASLRAPFTLEPAASARPPNRRVRASVGGVAALGVAYVLAAALAWPLGVVAVVGGLALVATDLAAGGRDARRIARDVPWSLFPLLAGLLTLVAGAERVGLFTALIQAGEALAGGPAAGAVVGVGAGLAGLSNVVNNLPAALIAATGLAGLPVGPQRDDLVAAAIVGVNLGPNLTPIGSLSTLLWLGLLHQRGVSVSALAYLRIGLVATVPALAAALAGLYVTTTLWR